MTAAPTPPRPIPAPPAHVRVVIQSVMHHYFDKSNDFHRSARAFRNRLVIMTLVTLAASGSLLIVQWRTGRHAAIVVAPQDVIQLSNWAVLLIVMLFGAIGALLTTVPAMTAIPTNPSPFNFPLQQAILKIVLGSLTAVIGVLAIGHTGATTGFSSFTLLLGTAAAFGAGQQAVTQFLDKKAGQIIDKAP